MKPTLIDQPYGTFASDILKTFEDKKPLSADQINFLARYEKTLSSYALDPVIKYYLQGYHNKSKKREIAFKIANQKLDEHALQRIKHNVQQLLKNNVTHVDLKMTLDQFHHFKTIGIHELIFWYGNRFLTGVPFYPGGIPHLVYVQWGNLFGVVKLQMLMNQKAIKGNVYIYFENMQGRTLYQCIKDYSHLNELELSEQNKLKETERVEESLIHKPSHSLSPYFYEIH